MAGVRGARPPSGAAAEGSCHDADEGVLGARAPGLAATEELSAGSGSRRAGPRCRGLSVAPSPAPGRRRGGEPRAVGVEEVVERGARGRGAGKSGELEGGGEERGGAQHRGGGGVARILEVEGEVAHERGEGLERVAEHRAPRHLVGERGEGCGGGGPAVRAHRVERRAVEPDHEGGAREPRAKRRGVESAVLVDPKQVLDQGPRMGVSSRKRSRGRGRGLRGAGSAAPRRCGPRRRRSETAGARARRAVRLRARRRPPRPRAGGAAAPGGAAARRGRARPGSAGTGARCGTPSPRAGRGSRSAARSRRSARRGTTRTRGGCRGRSCRSWLISPGCRGCRGGASPPAPPWSSRLGRGGAPEAVAFEPGALEPPVAEHGVALAWGER